MARLRKACAAVLFWHQKSTQKSAAVSHAADPRASQGAPAGAAVFPWHVRRSGLANAKSKAFAFTASRALPVARRPPWAGEGKCCAFGEAVLRRAASLLLRKKLWTQREGTACSHRFHLRKMTTRQMARLRKTCVAVLFWHQKSTQKSAAVPHAADPRASRGAPAGAAVFP